MSLKLTRPLRLTLLSLAVLLLVYTLLGFFLAPRLVRAQIEEFAQRHYGHTPRIGEIRVNPFTLSLELRDFEFRDSRAEPMIAFQRLLVNLDLSSLWRRGLSFHAIELDRPAGRLLVRPDGALNLAELTAPFAATTPPAATPAEPARLFIDRFRLTDGALEFEDQARATPFRARLAPVTFELLDFSTTGESGNRYSLQATSSAGERFRWNGSFGLAPLSSRGQFELADVQARTLWSYLQESLGFEIASGVVGVQGGYEFAATEPAITLNLTVSRLQVAGLGVRARGGTEDWVHLELLTVEDTRADLAARALHVGRVRLANARLLARRDADGGLNLTALTQSPATNATDAATPADDAATASSPAAGPVPSGGAGWVVNVPDIETTGTTLDVVDEFVSPTARFTLAPVNVAVRGFSSAPGSALDLTADITVQSGGHLAFQGSRAAGSPALTGRLELEQLDLSALQPYIGSYSQMTLRSGLLSAALEARWQPEAWELSGRVQSTRLHTVDNALREDFVKWDDLALEGIQFRSRPQSLRIATVAARAPYVRLIIAPDQSTNVGQVLTRPATAPGPVQTVRELRTPPTGVSQPLAIQIGDVRIRNGSANFADFWITPNYAVSLQQLDGHISGLSSRRDSRAQIALTGKIDRYAPVDIRGELNLLSASLFTDVRVKFDGVELTSVTPYSGRFAGYRIEKGKLSVDVRYRVENRKLDAEQRFVVDQLTLGERVDSPDAVRLPLRLAVALLKDRNGVIDLGLPVSGSLDDPRFRLGPIIWKAFVGLLTNVATSPFKLLGGLFGGGEEVNLIDFAPGEAVVDAAAADKLAALRRALVERPQLALEIPAAWSPDADYPVLAARQLEQELAALAARTPKPAALTPEDTAAQRFELLLSLHRSRKPGTALPPAAQATQALRARERTTEALLAANRELEAALLPTPEALATALENLAQLRARHIQDALLSSGEVEPARVFLLAPAARPAVSGRTQLALALR